MKLIMTLLVRDEGDIISTNIDYHLSQGVDFFIVTDNLSEDNTLDILKEYQSQGILHIIEETSDDYSQHRWVTRMARMAFNQYAADWVINNDADEFWWSNHSDKSLKSVLSTFSRNVHALSVQRKNFLAPPMNNGFFFAEAMTLRDVVSYNTLGQLLPSKVCHLGCSDIEIAQGNHSVSQNDIEIVAQKTSQISIFHFPLRGYDHFENKIIKGGRAYERNKKLNKGVGETWRNLYACYLKGGLLDYYEQSILDKKAIEAGLSANKLVYDLRLFNYITKLRNE